MTIQILHNNRCGKSRCALDILEKSNNKFEIISYLNGELTKELLLEIIEKTGKKPLELIRTKEAIFKEKYEGKKLTDAQCIKAILENPILLERPIVIADKKASIVRNEAEIAWLKSEVK